MLETLKRDIQVVFERDPAARTTLEIALCYPGLHAIWGYRLAHWLWVHGLKAGGRVVSQAFRLVTGVEIHPGAVIGPGFFIDHGMGIVIGETAEVGTDVTLYHGVTLGGTSSNKGKRHPSIGDRVVIGAGAKVLGAFTVGHDSRIGANAVVVKAVPPNSVVVGVPGQVIHRSKDHTAQDKPDLDHIQLPDTLGISVASLLARVEALEKREQHYGYSGGASLPAVHVSEAGEWQGEDFSI